MTDPIFLDCRNALDAAMKSATENGLSLNRKIAAPIPHSPENNLWKKGILGRSNPAKLARTLIYLISVNCGLRGGQELRRLKWGQGAQLTLKKLHDGTEVLHYMEDVSKTNRGGLRDHYVRPKCLNVYPAEEKDKCVVELFKLYSQLLPANDTSGAFFL